MVEESKLSKQTKAKIIWTKLFSDFKMKEEEIRFSFLVTTSKKIRYRVVFNQRRGGWKNPGRGWIVSKMREDNWTIRKTTPAEREAVISYCQDWLKTKGLILV